MTQTTEKRQIGLLIKGVLAEYSMDNLQLEIDLTSALHRYFFERNRTPDIAKLRETILGDLLKGAAKEIEASQMEGRVKFAMGISIDGRSRYDDMIRFLLKKDKEGETIEKYAQWCTSNPYTAPKFFKIAERPDLLIETWWMAFREDRHKTDETRPDYSFRNIGI